jgi:hypothetical protein
MMTCDETRNLFEQWCTTESPKWPTDRKPNGEYSNAMTQRHWYEWVLAQPPCSHGHKGYCGTCEAAAAPKCLAHGNPWYCGYCGPEGKTMFMTPLSLTHEARRYCKGDDGWTAWQPCTAQQAEVRKRDGTFQVRLRTPNITEPPRITTVGRCANYVIGLPSDYPGGNYRDGDPSGDDEADARLMAAAPELLGALNDLLDVMTGRKEGEAMAIQNAVLAINKATGAV